jgi:hypothetical protein
VERGGWGVVLPARRRGYWPLGPVGAIANATDEGTEELLEVATDSARRDIIGTEQTAEQVQRDLERMSREASARSAARV